MCLVIFYIYLCFLGKYVLHLVLSHWCFTSHHVNNLHPCFTSDYVSVSILPLIMSSLHICVLRQILFRLYVTSIYVSICVALCNRMKNKAGDPCVSYVALTMTPDLDLNVYTHRCQPSNEEKLKTTQELCRDLKRSKPKWITRMAQKFSWHFLSPQMRWHDTLPCSPRYFILMSQLILTKKTRPIPYDCEGFQQTDIHR